MRVLGNYSTRSPYGAGKSQPPTADGISYRVPRRLHRGAEEEVGVVCGGCNRRE
jgi:hypothetical protein